MRTLKGFIKQLDEEKNVHMEHIEDLIFNEGVDGTRKAINFLRDLRDMLAGSSASKVTATVKWDGAPAVFAGVDPSDGKFFVAKKGVFNKNPKIYKTAAEVDVDTEGDLAVKLKIALAEFKKLGIKSGVFQGDLMFTAADLKTETIDGQKYTTFHPNTIVYAVPYESDLAKKIRAAKIGVVWHTTYTGNSFETMQASFGKSIVTHLTHVSSVWMDDANYKDYSGTATFTQAETTHVTEMLSAIGKLFNQIPAATINGISNDPDLSMLVKTYNNTKVREGVKINPSQHVDGLFKWIYDRYQKEIETKKTEKGKSAQEEKRKKILAFFANHDKQNIVKIFQLSNMIADVKGPIIAKMNQAGHINTFVKTASGFKATGVEGFVAIDHLKGGAVKIVDRMEFSRNNFSAEIIKGFDKTR
jgi:hypothetical protein